MKVDKLIRKSEIFLKRNSSTILTCIGAAGVVATGVLAATATPKALILLEEAKEKKGEELTMAETFITVAPAYVPAVLTGVSTIACIFGANALNKRSQASLISAYALLDNSYKEYRDKVLELHGEEAEQNIRHEIVKDKYSASDRKDGEKQLFFDSFSMRYFESTIEDVLRAEHLFSKTLINFGYANLNEFYDMLGLNHTDYGYELGWSTEADRAFYGYSWLEFEHEKILLDDGLECTIISANQEPDAGYMGF
jgi:hypothetical protein